MDHNECSQLGSICGVKEDGKPAVSIIKPDCPGVDLPLCPKHARELGLQLLAGAVASVLMAGFRTLLQQEFELTPERSAEILGKIQGILEAATRG